ncbi:MAG: Slp family lipoprotein [Candidatus Sulfobium sp.]|jgi:outer membrane lipoprotein
MTTRKGLLLCFAVLFLVSACAYPISKGLRKEAEKSPRFATVLKSPGMYTGSVVIWGGIIIETINHKKGSEVLVLETPLDYEGEPEDSEYSHGRFIATTSGYLDPEIYRKGRKVTVAGEIISPEKRKIGETTYTYPVISIREIHIWKVQEAYYPPSYYGYGWYGPYYGYGPYWGPPFGPWPYWWY